MVNPTGKNDLEGIHTLYKSKSDGNFLYMSQEIVPMKFTKFEKVVPIDSSKIVNVFHQEKIQFDEESQNEKKRIPLHVQIMNLFTSNISLNSEGTQIKYTIYYNVPKLVSLVQYFYYYKEDALKIFSCFFKIGCLLQELAKIVELKLSLLNIYLNEKEEIVIIMLPRSFINDEIRIDNENPNLLLLPPPERQEEMRLDKFYSFLLGICMLRAMEDEKFKKAFKIIVKNNYQLQVDYTLELLKLISESKRKNLFNEKLKLIIK